MKPVVKKNNMTFKEFYQFHQPAVHQQVMDELLAANTDFVVDSYMKSLMLGAKILKNINERWEAL